RVVLLRGGKAPDQGGDVLDGVEAGGDAHHHAVLVHVGAQPPEIGQTVGEGAPGVEGEAVINGIEVLGVEAPGDQQVHHGVADADAVVEQPQGDGVHRAVGQAAQGPAHVVQAVV